MESLKSKWQAMSLPTKIITILGLPLILVALLLKTGGGLSKILNSRSRARTDEKDKELEQAQAGIQKDIDQSEGRLQEIKKSKKKALKDAKNEKPTDFFNSRYPDDK